MSEPVDEVSQSFGLGITRGLTIARTVADLVRGLNAEDRSRLESLQRITQNAELHAARLGSITADEGRSQERHEITVQQRRREMAIAEEDVVRRNLDSVQRNAREERETAARVGSTHLRNDSIRLNAALRVAEHALKRSDSAAENARRERVTEAQVGASEAREDTARTEGQIKREDQGRRIQRETDAEAREKQLHDRRIGGYDNRETRAQELHDLQKAAIRQQMKIRARAAELTQNLTGQQQRSDNAMAAAGQFAAAVSTAGRSDEHRAAADAFTERFRDDTGLDPAQFDDALKDFGDLSGDPVEVLATILENAQAPDADPAAILAARYLTNLLATDAEPGPDHGGPIGDAVADANAVANPAATADVEAGPVNQTSAPEKDVASEVGP
ncbi:hypothetical protein [Nocardia abscessus]|uniref:hypothetical protein n=1 Tax=Nocardia abscessus TaxID=120957 RepID=UPI0024579CFC|nr:hypothetical protein [Nocardia abscessus]